MRSTAAPAIALLAVLAASAATPPALVNYQGVLRNAADKPQSGTYDMTFRFFDAQTAGNEILVDAHTGGGSAVTVANGLFSAALGGGTVTDGSGAGTYTSLAQVFRDFAAVWMQIEVSGEVLTPRIRVQASAYALNAANLEGKPAASFVDTSSATQTKSGHLTVSGGVDASVASGIALSANGTQAGGSFGAGGAFAYVADTGVINTGIRAQGNDAGGWFRNGTSGTQMYAASSGAGVQANGPNIGGSFGDSFGDSAYVAYLGAGISASGSSTGGQFYSSGSGASYLAYGNTGIQAYGAPAGYFYGAGFGYANVSSGDFGIMGYGKSPGAGGYFADPNASGKAWVGFGDYGIYGIGGYTGGFFTLAYHNVDAWIGSTDHNGFPTAVYGYSAETFATPGYFRDDNYGSDAWPGAEGHKIYGNGNVSFVQNHPEDAGKVIVYAAPEGDETAVYTRGSARLSAGEARVALGETFAWVTNPDIGLTATVTPRGHGAVLYVVSVSPRELVVRSDDPAARDLAFDYMVWGLRIGFEDRAVVERKRREAYIPSHRVEEDQYAVAPELRRYSALSRFKAMTPEIALDLGASQALERKIHVYDQKTDGIKVDAPGRLPSAPATVAPTPAVAATPAHESVTGPKPIPNATYVPVSERIESGEVVSHDAVHPGELRRAAIAADPGVIGVVAGEPGTEWTQAAPLALSGSIVLCKVDASYGAIEANDLLVASATAGYGMRAGDAPKQGSVIGKALEPLEGGTGTIRVLVMAR